MMENNKPVSLEQMQFDFPSEATTDLFFGDDSYVLHYLHLWLSFWMQNPEPVIGDVYASILEEAWSPDFQL